MWDIIKDLFEGFPAQERVAKVLLEYGLAVRDGDIFCGELKMTSTSIARYVGCDRRVVLAAVETIQSKKKVRDFYGRLEPTCSFKKVAPLMGWGVIEIIPEDVHAPGIIASVTNILAGEGISLRQVVADDPEWSENPKAFIVTETPVPARLLPEMKSCPGVRGVTIY